MATTPEGKVKVAVKKWLKSRGAFFFMPVAGPFSTHGLSDIVGCMNGTFFAIETKAPGKRNNATLHQKRFIEAVREHGGIADVVDDVSQLEELFDGR